MDARNSNVFREIHKNTWLKRLSVDNKKVLVGPKKSERSWVVFCVHDDCEAILEGYVEPRQAAQHQPEWTVSLQQALHVSHSLVPSEHEYEFVVTLPAEVVRFNAPTWDVMLEWVDTLRQKLREMKIMSPKENLYSRLPELRAPLLPTRDPQSPLPAPPPVPAALVPGIERIVPASATAAVATTAASEAVAATEGQSAAVTTTATIPACPASTATSTASITSSMPASAMSNTLTQNLINMLSNPVVSAYNAQPSSSHHHHHPHHHHENNVSLEDSFFAEDDDVDDDGDVHVADAADDDDDDDEAAGNTATSAAEPPTAPTPAGPANSGQQPSMARIFADNVLADPNTCSAKEHATDAEGSGRGATSKTRPPAADADASSLDSMGSTVFQSEPIIIPRPQTSRSSAREKAPTKRRVATASAKATAASSMAIVLPAESVPPTTVPVQHETAAGPAAAASSASASNITIIQVSSPHIKPSTTSDTFQFPSSSGAADKAPSTKIEVHDDQYKSNVQIIPSNPPNPSTALATQPQPVTTVQVTGATVDSSGTHAAAAADSGYGKIKRIVHIDDATGSNVSHVSTGGASLVLASTTPPVAVSNNATATTIKPAINSFVGSGGGGAVTNIPIGNSSSSSQYEPLFVSQPTATPRQHVGLASPKPVPKQRTLGGSGAGTPTRRPSARNTEQQPGASVASSRNAHTVTVSGPSTSTATVGASLHNGSGSNATVPVSSTAPATHTHSNNNHTPASATTALTPSTPAQSSASAVATSNNSTSATSSNKLVNTMRENLSSPLPAIRKLLTRGLTDMSITRPSRSRDPQSSANAGTAAASVVVSTPRPAVDSNGPSRSRPSAAGPAILASEQRRRSSSHSEAQRGRNGGATAAQLPQQQHQQRGHNNGHNSNNLNNNASEHQQLHRPLVPKHSALAGASGPTSGPSASNGGSGSRMTLREQQVLELRKEMRHMGGVRIQLRRKDCQGSIALCDAFGAVWVCGWKQKDHPILYYALHIGDQVVQVAGCSVACTADVQRIIRNVQGLYIDFILRRLPFGRVYAIRRDMENQCLGLIRDGNTATIVDVVPKSLSARHGLPPKAPSCDGLSLTFWVLTEINGRPLNLFFKDNEVRDRLNASGRDISVLVQPADLIAKLKKHLKSMRGYKDYIVQ